MLSYSVLRYSLFKVLIAVCELQLFLIIANSQPPEYLSHVCPNTTTYNQNSIYQANLNSLLSDLSSNNASNNLFFNASAGNNAPDVIYGLVLCRGDVTIDECHECLQRATREIVEMCPNEKESVVWYQHCMLRYSNKSFFGSMATDPSQYLFNVNNVSNPERFDQELGDVMNKLFRLASGTESVGPLRGFATGESYFTNLSLFNLVQCTPDLSDCTICLRTALSQRPYGQEGGIVLFPSCSIRYETYPFYKSIAATSAPPPSITPSSRPPPPPAQVPATGSGGKEQRSAAVIVAIVVPIIVVSIFLFTVAFCLWRRKAKKQQNVLIDSTGGVDGNDISAPESLQYDLNVIKVATNNFSADNKIGEGGFGEVFKGTLNGQQIAVKRLSKGSGQGEKEFKNEVL